MVDACTAFDLRCGRSVSALCVRKGCDKIQLASGGGERVEVLAAHLNLSP